MAYQYKIVIRKIITRLTIHIGCNGHNHLYLDFSPRDNNELIPPIALDITNELQPIIPNTIQFGGYTGYFDPPKPGLTSWQFQFIITKQDLVGPGPVEIIYNRWDADIVHGVAQNTLAYREDFDIVKE